jgi:micrococcal nuclease
MAAERRRVRIFAAIECRLAWFKGRTLLARQVFGGAVAALLMSTPALAVACEALLDGPRGVVTGVTDGDTVILDHGLVIRLIGTQAPKLPLGRDGFEAWPMADTAQEALADLVLGKPVLLRYGGERVDRHGRTLGQLFIVGDPAVWVQHEMVTAGLARVYSFPDNRACLAELMAAETHARTMKLGIWADPYYTVRRADRPEALASRAGHYELIEGRVLLADTVGRRVFLNFGRHWKEDFTAVIEESALRMFGEAGFDPLMLEGALVRVRGWVDNRDGPRVEVTHPEQIEVLATR